MTIRYHAPLTPEEQATFGLPSPEPLAMADQVRFGELDVLQHVNNAVYMQWFERIRVHYTRIWGLARSFSDPSGPRIVIRSGTIHYKQEMLLDEDYVVTCRCKAFRKTSFTVRQQLWANGSLRATFDCVLVLLQKNGSDRYPLPDELCRRFREVDGAAEDA